MPDRGLSGLSEREAAMLAASWAELAASNRLAEAQARLASAIRRTEAGAGSLAAEALHKTEANAAIRAEQALGAYREAVRLRAREEFMAEVASLGVVDLVRPSLDAFERHVMTWRGAVVRSQRDQILKAALALASEAGEVAGAIEKWAYRDAELNVPGVIGELGDVLYNLGDLTLALGASMRDLLISNTVKWGERYPGGPSQAGPKRQTWRAMVRLFLRR